MAKSTPQVSLMQVTLTMLVGSFRGCAGALGKRRLSGCHALAVAFLVPLLDI
jgi:hypothetical protein